MALATGLFVNSTANASVTVTTGSSSSSSSSSPTFGLGCYGHFTTSGSLTCGIATCPVSCAAANASVAYTGACYDQWNQYWNATASIDPSCTTDFITSCYNVFPSTVTLTNYESTELSGVIGTEFITETFTDVISDGAFPIATVTETVTEQVTQESTRITKTILQTTTVLYTSVSYPFIYNSAVSAALPTPNCTLPPVVSECQSSWNNYITSTPAVAANDTGPTWDVGYWGDALIAYQQWPLSQPWGPRCTAASIARDLCSSIHDRFGDLVAGGTIQSSGYHVITTESSFGAQPTVTSYWPSNFTFAPACTQGCSACHITGGSVQLLYWPEATASPNISARAGATPVTAVYQDFTLTSPTNYIAFSKLYASDSCSAIGATYTSTIIPISRSADLSSLYGYDWRNTAHLYTASFNLADFDHEPVPNSVYNSMPRCAASLTDFYGLYESGDNYVPSNTANFTCTRIDSYRPIISIPPEVRAVDPAWAQCAGALEGIFDPPIALTQAGAADGPSISGQQTSASPQPSPTSGGAPRTTTSPQLNTQTTPTAAPDMLGSTSNNGDDPQASTSAEGASSNSAHSADTTSKSVHSAGGDTGSGNGASQSAGHSQPPEAGQSDSTSTTPDIGGIIISVLGSQSKTSGPSSTPSAEDPSSQNQPVGQGSDVQPTQTASNSASGGNGDPGSSSDGAQSHAVIGTSGGQTIVADPSNSNAVVVDGSRTLQAGGAAATVDGQTLSYHGSGSVVVQSDGHQSTLTLGAGSVVVQSDEHQSTIVPGAGSVVVQSDGHQSTIAPGAGSVVVQSDGHQSTIAPGASIVVVQSDGHQSTITLGAGSASGLASLGAALTVGSSIITAVPITESSGVYSIGGTTISVGGSAVTIDGQAISAVASGVVVADGRGYATTLALSTINDPAIATTGALIPMGSGTLTANQITGSSGAYLVDGTTLSVGGPALTEDGRTISAGSNGVIVMSGSRTVQTVSFGQTTPSVVASDHSFSAGVTSSVAGTSPSTTGASTGAGNHVALNIWMAVLASVVALFSAL